MYRVFESLNEMVQIVDQAYGVPMTANCMVPRNEMQLLLDVLRNALPAELDDAQDVLDHQDEIIDEASERARTLVDDAEAEAEQTLAEAKNNAELTIEDAHARATSMVSNAQDEAQRIVDDARREAEAVKSRAEAEAERLIASGNDHYERSINEALAEQHRLVSEAEVVRRANEEAHRIVDAAHAESNQLRGKCDEFVDSKLAEFEASMSAVIRQISADRSALRRGAGASRGQSAERRTHRGYDADGHDSGYDS